MTQSFGACKKHWHQACKGSMSLQKAASLGRQAKELADNVQLKKKDVCLAAAATCSSH